MAQTKPTGKKPMKEISKEDYKERLRFSWLEMFSNTDGKTSASAFVGTIVSIACLLLFVTLMLYYFFNPGESSIVLAFIDKLSLYFGIAASLLGLKSIGIFSKNANVSIGGAKKASQPED